jgi:hypothetical protein
MRFTRIEESGPNLEPTPSQIVNDLLSDSGVSNARVVRIAKPFVGAGASTSLKMEYHGLRK